MKKKPLVVFGNVAVGPIAIGNVAVGYVAIGLSLAVGPIAIGVNSVGFLLAAGVNAIGLFALGGANGIGGMVLAGANGFGAFAWSYVNHGESLVFAALLALLESGAGLALFLRERQTQALYGGRPFPCRTIDSRGLVRADGTLLPWSDSVATAQRDRWIESFVQAERAHVFVHVEREVVPQELAHYRDGAPDDSPTFNEVCTKAEVQVVERPWLLGFRRTLWLGATLAGLMAVARVLH